MLVLDASALLEVLLRRSGSERIMDEMIERGPLHLAQGTDLAVLEVLRHYHRLGEMSDERVRQAVDSLGEIDFARYALHDLPGLADRTWQLTESLIGSAAAAVALAEALGAFLVTCDEAVETAASRNHVLRVV